MKLTCLIVAVTAFCPLVAPAPPPKPKIVPLEIIPRPELTTLYFRPGISQEVVELYARGAAEKGSEIVGYFGLPPDGHEMGFTAHFSTASMALMSRISQNYGLNGSDILRVDEGSAPAGGDCTVLERFAIPGCSGSA